jgi:release factor glutamine methyltransferase
MSSSQRCWLPYEKNYLLENGISLEDLNQYGHQPVEYIVKWAKFLNRQFKVNPAVLIPRVETEQLVEIAVDEIKKRLKVANGLPVTVADVGTGSGAIGISIILELAQKMNLAKKQLEMFLSDVSDKALNIAKNNYSNLLSAQLKNNLKENVKVSLLKSDLLADYPSKTKFDLIIANLPYIPSAKLLKLPKSVKDFEPMMALDGGVDGLEIVRKLMGQVKPKLKSHGLVLLEVDSQVALNRKSLNLSDDMKMEVLKDNQNQQRFVRISLNQFELGKLED